MHAQAQGRFTRGNVCVEDEGVVVRTAAHAGQFVGLLKGVIEEVFEQELNGAAAVLNL